MQAEQSKVVFLDIDGVLQPFSNTRRFQVDATVEAAAYAESVGDPFYKKLDPRDVCAVLFDWDPEAVGNLKAILERAGAEIVVSSDWRDYNEDTALKALLAIHDLGSYLKGSTAPFTPKAESIMDYLSEHEGEIAAYVILDDNPRVSALPNGLQVAGSLTEQDAEEALRILAGQGRGARPK